MTDKTFLKKLLNLQIYRSSFWGTGCWHIYQIFVNFTGKKVHHMKETFIQYVRW